MARCRSHGSVRALRAGWLACVVAAWLGLSQRALAAGVEDFVGGSITLGRAANYVRVNDFMAVWQNPANLALVPKPDAGLELRLPIYNACFDRTRNPDLEYKPQESFNKVCNSDKVLPTGNGGFVMSFGNGIGFGVGFYTPSGVAKSSYGDDTIITFGSNFFPNEKYPTTTTGTESANRYLLLSRQVLAGFLMAGIGWEIIPQLRIGASFGPGFANIQFSNVSSLTGKTFVDQEVLTKVNVSDWFIPRGTFSVTASPIDAVELMAQVTVTGDISATGHVDATANGIQGAPLGNCKSENPGPHCRVNDVTLKVPYQRAEVYLGGRYAHYRKGKHRGYKLDPLAKEIWDIELDLLWAKTSNVDAYRLSLYNVPPSDPNAARIDFTSDPSGTPSPLPPNAVIPHNWRDTWGFRLGGDWNILPSFLAARAGISYESNAVRAGYANLDYYPVNRVGLHVGASMLFGSRWKVSLAYAHFFYNQTTVPLGGGRVPEIVALDRAQAKAVNEGSYSARLDIVSLQGNVSF